MPWLVTKYYPAVILDVWVCNFGFVLLDFKYLDCTWRWYGCWIVIIPEKENSQRETSSFWFQGGNAHWHERRENKRSSIFFIYYYCTKVSLPNLTWVCIRLCFIMLTYPVCAVSVICLLNQISHLMQSRTLGLRNDLLESIENSCCLALCYFRTIQPVVLVCLWVKMFM